MTEPAPLNDCWNQIGIFGDRSCPELVPHFHCRNCPVYTGAARSLFDRKAPPGYLEDWSRFLAAPAVAADEKNVSLLIFRLGQEWLALNIHVVVEVTTPRPVHQIPHRSNEILKGLVNLRGQLQLSVSLHGLLDPDSPPRPSTPDPRTRLIVIKRESHAWVFESDEVLGVHRFARARLGAVPSTLSNPANSFSQSFLHWRDRSIGLLDDARVFAALKRLGQ